MKKTILFSLSGLLISFSNISAQEKKEQKPNRITPFIESSYQLGLCGESNPFAFILGVEKPVAKHLSVSADVHLWKTDYETWCCDIHSKGTYTAVTPSIKIKFDPGKPNKGFFIGAGIGYVFTKDRGTEQPYLYDAAGTKTMSGEITNGNWDFQSIAPSFNWGIAFKISRFPVALINTNYFGKSTWGWEDIATGVGLRFGLRKVPGGCCGSKKKCK
jgi:hypothetical protein